MAAWFLRTFGDQPLALLRAPVAFYYCLLAREARAALRARDHFRAALSPRWNRSVGCAQRTRPGCTRAGRRPRPHRELVPPVSAVADFVQDRETIAGHRHAMFRRLRGYVVRNWRNYLLGLLAVEPETLFRELLHLAGQLRRGT